MTLCFISYARSSNYSSLLTRFVERLEKLLPAYLPHHLGQGDVIFFDTLSIETAEEWRRRLEVATRQARVCVCFYSPPYFTSENCGREVKVFLERVNAWGRQAANAGRQARAIIPVVWIPHEPIPTVLQPFQWTHAKLPRAYVEEGLLALAMRKARVDAYNTVLVHLARQIADTLKNVELPDGPPIPAYDALPSAFHEDATPVRYGAAVMMVMDPTRIARPFAASGESLPALISAIANRCALPMREVPVANMSETAIAAEIAASTTAREMPVIVTDGATLGATLNAKIFSTIARALDGSATIVLLDDPDPSAATAAVRVRKLASARLLHPSADVRVSEYLVCTDAKALGSDLERRLLKVRHELIAGDPAARAEDPALETAAAAQGIGLGSKPVLSGPGA